MIVFGEHSGFFRLIGIPIFFEISTMSVFLMMSGFLMYYSYSERELSIKEKTIQRLKEQEKVLKTKLKQYELFIDVKGLVGAFKEFIRPKTIQEQLEEKKAVVESQKKVKTTKVDLKKEYDRVV